MTISSQSAEVPPSGEGIARAAGILSLGNVASRVLGLVRQTVIADLFGASPYVSAFVAAARVPTMIYDLLIGGAISAALIPVFSDYAHDEEGAARVEGHLCAIPVDRRINAVVV